MSLDHLSARRRAPLRPETLEEHLVYGAMTWTYGFYLLGALYLVGPALGWALVACLAYRVATDPAAWSKPLLGIPPACWLWVAAMGALLVALLVAHLQMHLGLAKTIKSSIGWAKGWALLAVFPLAASVRIRPEILYRGAAKVCALSLAVVPLVLLAPRLGLPEVLYVSPLRIVGGPGDEFFSLRLYSLEPGGGFRYWLFTPWAPALGFVANVYFVLILRERNLRWRLLGSAGALAMVLISGSRLAVLALVIVQLASWGLVGLLQPVKWIAAGVVAFSGGLLASTLRRAAEDFLHRFHAARIDSSRVRETLGRIAVDRWRDEAPVWGHGVVERGPHLVEYMPIGSHHTWFGLLFVKGAVGFAALATAMLWSFFELWIKAQGRSEARAGLGVLLVLMLYSFGENLEILAYLYWPGLIVMGLGFRAPLPFIERLGATAAEGGHRAVA